MAVNDFVVVGNDGYPTLKGFNPTYVSSNFVDADILKTFTIKHSSIQAKDFEPKAEIVRIMPATEKPSEKR